MDNVRVESLESVTPPAPSITSIGISGGVVRLQFTGTGEASQFTVEGAPALPGSFTPEPGVTIQSTGAGQFEATLAVNGESRFYRVRR